MIARNRHIVPVRRYVIDLQPDCHKKIYLALHLLLLLVAQLNNNKLKWYQEPNLSRGFLLHQVFPWPLWRVHSLFLEYFRWLQLLLGPVCSPETVPWKRGSWTSSSITQTRLPEPWLRPRPLRSTATGESPCDDSEEEINIYVNLGW